MNRNNYRLVDSRLREMPVAVSEMTAASGKETGRTGRIQSKARKIPAVLPFELKQIAIAASVLTGALPSWADVQTPGGIVPSGPNAPAIVQTHNGLPQVNINRPSGAGVSMNTYGQFDVQPRGAILNNSPAIVQTQQAGMINGNPNLGAGEAARVIVNQVNSGAASQINGYLEVAGRRAEVVIANGSGISVNGGGFINTSRAVLTTGTPNLAADGSLSGFNVSHGNIGIAGAGLDASSVDQVDLLARAVQANAAIHAKNLNIVTGANAVGHDTLNATPIAGDGPAPAVSIDVASLGGMYANRIWLVGTEHGVGVSTKGVLAAQAGDLTLTTEGKLVLAGQTNASGDLIVSARDGIDNIGTTYAKQNVMLSTAGALTNSGLSGAQQNTTVSAGSVSSTGTLAAGLNADGSLAQSGALNVSASGAVTATGRNAAGGNALVSGAAVSLAGSTTSANRAIALAAIGGDLNLSGATTTAGGSLDARAAGTLTNDSGAMSSGGAQTITAHAVSNRGGRMVAPHLTVTASGTLDNSGGDIDANALALHATTLLNHAGTMTQYGLSSMGFDVSGTFSNAGGQIIAAGRIDMQAGSLNNVHGVLAAQGTSQPQLQAT